MKNNLLEAIGFVDEQLLHEAQKTEKRNGHCLRRMVLVAAILAAFAFTALACTGALKGLLSAEKNGASVANLSSSTGNFVYDEGAIYHGVFGYIYKCDTDGTILQTYTLGNQQIRPCYLFVSADAIVYAENVSATELSVLPKDGSEPYTVDLGIGITNAYADGQFLYTTDGGNALYQVDLITLEKRELLQNVAHYFVDDTYIYAIQADNKAVLYRSTKEALHFETIPLDFVPCKVIANGEALYLCRWEDTAEQGRSYRVNLVHEGTSTALPVYAWLYQVVNGEILYLENETASLKCYNTETGKISLIAENVYEFSVLEDRYLCMEYYNGTAALYDLSTGHSYPVR